MDGEVDLDRLVLEHLPAALRFAGRLTGNPDLAEETVQDALLNVVRNWPAFRGQASFRTWFFRIVINVFRDRLRRSPSTEGTLLEETPDPRIVLPPEAAMGEELGRLIAGMVSALPPRQREVLVLTGYEGMTITETAEVLEIGEAAVHAALHVARRRLRQQLAPYLER